MNITILDNREIIIDSSDNFGTQNENKASVINFSFPESLANANKKIVFITSDGNFWDLITDNSYKITNSVTKYKSVSAYVWLVDVDKDIDFRSKMWKMTFNKNEEPSDVVPSEQEISVFDTMIAQLNSAITQVDNLDIDATKSGTISTVTITNKEGVEKSVEINDGEDYIITEEDYQAIADIVEGDLTSNYYNKTETDNLLANKVDKETGKELIETTKITKLDGIENGAEVNIIEGVKVNGTELTPENKLVDISVPVDLKDLNEDSTHRTVTDIEKTTWNNKSDFSGNYNDLSNKPTIPTKTSDLTNDSGFIDNTVNNLINYTLKTNTGSLIDLEINSTTYVVTLSLKNIDGTVISTDTIDLPLESVVVSGRYDNTTKQVILTLENGSEVAFSVADLVAGLQTEITSQNKLASDLVDDSNSGNKFVTTSEKNTWNAKYDKPSGGIPDTDLSSAVQTSLGKADTALQEETYTGTITSIKMNGNTIATSGEADLGTVITEHQDITGKEDKSNKVTSIDENSTNTQYPGAKLVYDELSERDEYIEELEAQIPENTVTGTDITVTDSADMEIVKFELEGQTEQVQTEQSANYLDTFLFTNKTTNGITLTVNDDGTLTLNGTATSTTVFDATLKQKINKNNYKLKINKKSGTISSQSIQFFLYTNGYSANKNTALTPSVSSNNVTLDSNEYEIERIVIPNGAVLNNVIIEVMVSASDISYVPFTPLSPTPDYPQDTHVVTGNCGVELQNKNELDFDGSKTSYGISSVYKNGEIQLSGTATSNFSDCVDFVFKNIKKGIYTFSIKNNFKYTIALRVVHEDNSYTNFIIAAGSNSVTVTLEKDVVKYRVYIYDFTSGTKINTTLYCQFEQGSTATPYIAYESETYPLSLGNIELCKIGDYQDCIYRNGDDWYVHKEIGKQIWNGTENWIYISTSGNRYAYQITLPNKIVGQYNPEYISNYFRQKSNLSWVEDGLISISNRSADTYLFISNINTVESLKTWLSTHNTTVYYVLATPTTTKITDPTLISQLNALYIAKTYKNTTNITTTGADLQPIIELTYKQEVYSKTEINSLVLEIAHPIGSLYWSFDSTNPSILFGGTWEQIKDKFILAAGDTYTAENTGGEATHTLTADEIPEHTHGSESITGGCWTRGGTVTFTGFSGAMSAYGGNSESMGSPTSADSSSYGFQFDATHEHDSVGGGQAHNNMPPYMVAYCWKRTA